MKNDERQEVKENKKGKRKKKMVSVFRREKREIKRIHDEKSKE